MKGLLLKDWYMLLKYGKSYLLVCIIFFAVSIFGNGNTFFMIYPFVLIGALSVTLISYDERSGWIGYGNTFPYTRKQFVSVKYIYAFGMFVLMMLLAFLAQLIRGVVYNMGIIDIGLLPGGAVGLIPPSIMLPIVFSFGSEKGRIAYIAVIIIACACLPLFNMMPENYTVYTNITIACLIVFPMTLLIFALSWFISIKCFEGREEL